MTISKTPEETLVTSPAIIVGGKVTMRVTMNDLHRQNSKRIQKHSEKLSKENMISSTLMKEEKKSLVNSEDASYSLMMGITTG